MAGWPESREALITEQERLGRADPEPWRPTPGPLAVGGCFVCFSRGPPGPGAVGDAGWAASALVRRGRLQDSAAVSGSAGAAYEAGLLALREGALLEAAIRRLAEVPDVPLVDATGRDHPRRAGLAVQIGAVLDLPTVGVTHRPLAAEGNWPPEEPGAARPLVLGADVVGYWVRTRRGTRPLAVHAAWRTDPETAVAVVSESIKGTRTPEPLRQARRVARLARAGAE